MTAVRDKTRYTPADAATYLRVLENTEIEPLVMDGLPHDAVAFHMACVEAMKRVPLNDPPKGAFNVHEYVKSRLGEALRIRNRVYFERRMKH